MVLNTPQEWRVAVYTPANVEPEYERAMLIMPNEQGAGLDDYQGVLAQHVATVVGARVLAFERPFSADQARASVPLRHIINHGYPNLVERTTERLAKIIYQEGVERAYTIGHSAAGLFSIMMAGTKDIAPIYGTIDTDPPAVRLSWPVWAEVYEFGGHQLRTERNKPDDGELPNEPLPEPLAIVDSVKRQLREVAEYSAIYRSPIGARTLEYLAKNRHEIGVQVYFPEFTFTGTAEYLRTLAWKSKDWAESRSYDPDAMPFNLEIIDGLYHSSFSNHDIFSDYIKKALAKLDAA